MNPINPQLSDDALPSRTRIIHGHPHRFNRRDFLSAASGAISVFGAAAAVRALTSSEVEGHAQNDERAKVSSLNPNAGSIASPPGEGQLFGINPEKVIQLVRDRAGCSTPPTGDGRKLALLVEGGGMRGVCSAGGLVALESLRLRNAFNQIYGTSAGAMNVAYFLSGQAVFGIQIYYKEINNKHFINYERLFKVVDVDYVFDHVVTKARPLDTAAILKAPTDFYVSVVDKNDGSTVVLRVEDHESEILSLLKASTALPVVYNRSVKIGSHRYIDGGLSTPVPLQQALDNGCTDLLVFLTNPPDFVWSQIAFWEKALFSMTCSRGNGKLQRVFDNSSNTGNSCRAICLGSAPPPRPINIATFCPANTDKLVSRLTTDATRLRQSAIDMALATLKPFGGSPDLIADLMHT